ncbi:hypothetical protein, conserved [Eimeria necatrix]|uniref:Kelch motif domain-containing protein n=1 Tax=Eimeria necatrix TaxID=51315 RepID=U6MFM0_9EIME|nr:hypothetical protein, conserved [Eimeria necatrix]CDJ62826.1 hypothetical protein, conserved [Eimeria necatrix]
MSGCMEVDYAGADGSTAGDSVGAEAQKYDVGLIATATAVPPVTVPPATPVENDEAYSKERPAAEGDASEPILQEQEQQQQQQQSLSPVRLHHPLPRVGHTICPFNLPAKVTPLQMQEKQEQQQQKHQARRLRHTWEKREQQRHQQLQATTHSSVKPDDIYRNKNGSTNAVEGLWVRSLVRTVLVGGCSADAATAAAAAEPNIYKAVESTAVVPGDAFLGFTAAEAAASLRQTPFLLLQQAASAAAARKQQQAMTFPPTGLPFSAAEAEERRGTAAGEALDRDWLETYILRLSSAGSRCWLWWRLQLSDVPGGPGASTDCAGAAVAVTPECRVHHAAASVSAERQCSAVAVFGGRRADGAFADNELYLLEVTALLSLDLPLYILGELLCLALADATRAEGPAAAVETAATGAGTVPTMPSTEAARHTAITTASTAPSAAATHVDSKEDAGRRSFGSNNCNIPPLLRWRVPLCVGRKPSARLGHSLVYAEPHLILYGGKDERGQLLSDVWLLDIFDWRKAHRPASVGTAAAATAAASVGVSTSTLAGEVSSAGARAIEATEALSISLCWVCLDLSASPLKPPGRFLHSCSVFFKTTGDGSCCIVVAGGWTSIVLPRARLYALHRDAKGHWRHCLLPVRVTNAADQRFMHASVCAGSSLLLCGGLQIRPSAPPCAVASPIVSHDALSHRSLSFPHVNISALVGHQAWQVGGWIFCFGGFKVNDDEKGPLNPVPMNRLAFFDACDLLPNNSSEPLLAIRYETHLHLQRRAAAPEVSSRQLRPQASHDPAAAAGDSHSCWDADSSGSSSTEHHQPAVEACNSNSSSPMFSRQATQTPCTTDKWVSAAGAATAATGVASGTAALASHGPVSAEMITAYKDSKRPCSRPWSFAASSLSEQPPPSETARAGVAVSFTSTGNAAHDTAACPAVSLRAQVHGQGRGISGMAGPPTGSGNAAMHTAVATVAVSTASNVAPQQSEALTCTPRRHRRVAALQALESFKLLPDTSASEPSGAVAPTEVPTVPEAATAAATEAATTPSRASAEKLT